MPLNIKRVRILKIHSGKIILLFWIKGASKEIIYIMAYRNTSPAFLTPQKRITPDKPNKALSTTQGSKFGQIRYSSYSPVMGLQAKDQGMGLEWQQKTKKLNELQSEVSQLKAQLASRPQTNFASSIHRHHCEHNAAPVIAEQHTLLKELGSKVQGLIKENSRLRQNVPNQQVSQLKLHNKNIKFLMKEVMPDPPIRATALNEIEDNSHMRDYIQRSHQKNISELRLARDRIIQSPPQTKVSRQDYSYNSRTPATPQPQHYQQSQLDQELLLAEKIKNMKNYFTLYVNTAIQANDDKLASYKRYIDALERRVASLQQIEERFKHYKFEQQVKLQESGKKKKNVSIAGPNVPGDFAEISVIQEEAPQPVRPGIVYQYFPNKERYRQIEDKQLRQELASLRQENKNLKELYEIVKQNYEREIEDHIRDNSERQQLIYKIQRLQGENNLLREDTRVKRTVYFTPQ